MDPNRPSRLQDKFIIRLPEGMRERIAEAAAHTNQSMNALITTVLEREFPQPTINLHELAAFLNGIACEAERGEEGQAYLDEVNRMLATAKTPWCVKEDIGALTFYPYADPPGSVEKANESADDLP